MAAALEAVSPGELEVDPLGALDTAIHSNVSSYDAQYLALARRYEVVLVTEDAPLRRAGRGAAASMREFLAGRRVQEG